MVEDETQLEESWNMAKAYFQRIDNLLTMADECQMKHKGLDWYEVLVSLYKELYPKMKPDEKEKAKKLLDELTGLKMEAMKKGKGTIPTRLFVGFELYLRQLLEDKKMLTPKSDDPSKSYRS